LREDEAIAEEFVLVRPVVSVGAGERCSPLRVVTLDRLERFVGNALVDQRGDGPDQCVAPFDVGVEEA
jgi:hypothetical protein